MKTLVYLFVIAMLLFAGCAKDEMFEEDMNLKSAKVKEIPIKGTFYSVPTAWDENGNSIAGYLVGNISHLGKLIPEQSPYTTTNMAPINEVSVMFWMEGHLCAANRDLLNYELVGTLDTNTGVVEADVTYLGGTGRLKKYTGNAHFTGQLDPATGIVYCTLEGTLYK